MTTTLLAHFDGKQALVLDEPADLPVGTQLRVHVEAIEEKNEVDLADDLFSPLIVGLDPTLAQTIASDPEFAAENMSQRADQDIMQRLPLTMDAEAIRSLMAYPEQAWHPLDIDIDPEIGRAISEE